MRSRHVVSFGVALLAGIAAAVGTAQYLKPPGRVNVLVAKKAIPKSSSITEELFAVHEIPGDGPVPANAVHSFDQIRTATRDHLLRHALTPGETLTMDNLIHKSESGLAPALRAGYVGFSVQGTAANSLGANLRPDHYVKVIAAMKGARGEKQYRMIMKNIRVIAVDRTTDVTPEKQADKIPTIIVLEVTDEEAKTLREAQDNGPISLALVAWDDQRDMGDRRGETDPRPALAQVLVARRDLDKKTEMADARGLFEMKQVRAVDVPARAVTKFEQVDADRILARSMKAEEILMLDYMEAREPKVELGPTMTIVDRRSVKVWMWKPDGRIVLHKSYRVPNDE